ncbi:MAG: hypothetical protein AAGG44_02040, partial [Planctomycetota bacterium]
MNIPVSMAQCIGLMAAVVCFAGCEDYPKFSVDEPKVVANAVSTDSSREYEWTYEHRGFAVRRPLNFSFFARVDRAQIQAAIEKEYNAFANARDQVRQLGEETVPDGLSAATYAMLNRYAKGHLPIEPTIDLTSDQGITLSGFDVSPDGKRLVTVGDKVRVWAIDEKSVTVEIDEPNATAAYFAGESSDIVLRQGDTLVRYNGETGTPSDEWMSDAEIRAVACDDAGETWGVLRSDGSVVALGPGFEKIDELGAGVARGESIAVQPQGDWIVANSEAGPMRWYLKGFVHEPTRFQAREYVPDQTICLAGYDADLWCGPSWSYSQSNNDMDEDGQPDFGNYLVFPQVLAAESCSRDGLSTWMLVAGRQPDSDGQWQYHLQDIAPASGQFSLPLILDQKPLAMQASRNGEMVALQYEDRLVVFPRMRWVDPDGNFTADNLGRLPFDGKGSEFDVCIQELAKLDGLRSGTSPGFLVGEIVMKVGKSWGALLRGQSGLDAAQAKDSFDAVEEWRKSDSPASIAASAVRYSNLMFNTYDYEVVERYRKNSLKEIKRIENDPLFGELALLLQMEHRIRREEAGQEAIDPLVEEYMNRFPTSMRAHFWIGDWMQGKTLGNQRDRYSYNSAVADLFPEPLDDWIYARQLVSVMASYQNLNDSLGTSRFRRGVKQMMELRSLEPYSL